MHRSQLTAWRPQYFTSHMMGRLDFKLSSVNHLGTWLVSQDTLVNCEETLAPSEKSKHIFQSVSCCDWLLNPLLSSSSCLWQEKHRSVVRSLSTGFDKVVIVLQVKQSQLHTVTSGQIWYLCSWEWTVLWKAPERENDKNQGWYLWPVLLREVCFQHFKVV